MQCYLLLLQYVIPRIRINIVDWLYLHCLFVIPASILSFLLLLVIPAKAGIYPGIRHCECVSSAFPCLLPPFNHTATIFNGR